MYGVVSHDKLPKNTFRPKCDHFCSFEFIWWGELWWHALYLEMLCEEIDFTVCYFKLDSQFCVCRLFVTFMSCIDDKRQSKNTGFFHPNRKIFFSKEFPAICFHVGIWNWWGGIPHIQMAWDHFVMLGLWLVHWPWLQGLSAVCMDSFDMEECHCQCMLLVDAWAEDLTIS